MSNERYDNKSKTLWVASSADADTLVPNDQIKVWTAALSNGKLSDGREVTAINVVFSDGGAAEYNHDALGFARVGTFVGSLEKPKSYSGEDASFGTKEDFGVS